MTHREGLDRLETARRALGARPGKLASKGLVLRTGLATYSLPRHVLSAPRSVAQNGQRLTRERVDRFVDQPMERAGVTKLVGPDRSEAIA